MSKSRNTLGGVERVATEGDQYGHAPAPSLTRCPGGSYCNASDVIGPLRLFGPAICYSRRWLSSSSGTPVPLTVMPSVSETLRYTRGVLSGGGPSHAVPAWVSTQSAARR